MRQTFKKHERLHGKKNIERLFAQGNTFFLHPFVVYHQIVPTTDDSSPACAVLLSVSKRKIPHATQRNLLKRRMKEAFRKNKQLIYNKITALQTDNLYLAFIYVSTEIFNFASLEKKMMEALERMENLQ